MHIYGEPCDVLITWVHGVMFKSEQRYFIPLNTFLCGDSI